MPTEPDPRDFPELPPGLAPAWIDTPRPRRGPKPAHTVPGIVAAAVTIADTDGLAAASLPNIAAALGLTTNALYRYIGSKEELLVLLADAGFGPPPAALEGSSWRPAVRAWSRAALGRYRGRPWLLDIPFRGDPVTPNRLGWTELLLSVLPDLSGPDALRCASLISDVTRATAERQRSFADPDSVDSPDRAADIRAFLRPLLVERGYALVASLTAATGFPAADEDYGLERVLDGIATRLP
ncbi:TetR/AcrR family transcriptional regulator [Actinokineospora enzanensis]|uniref:TetR/AcrR family transcriptional regulator n=1 Tax=Actinokineospora enzanensis TaxID=155975 RepID=UPI0003731361|nr:TetR/AcrR family transcriptional regulator [Actinokineospora enzanensis]